MQDNKKVCSSCSTANGNEFTYCKNCGNLLFSHPQEEVNTEPREFVPPQSQQNAFYENDDVGAKTMSVFVGKNADTYLSRFTTMKILQKKTSWHWPVFILGVLLGPVGIAIWFFYRKMNKLGILSLILGFLLNLCDLWASFVYPMTQVINTLGTEIFELDKLNEFILWEFGKTFFENTHPLSLAVYLVNILTIILASCFAFKLYEKFAIKRIKILCKTESPQYPLEYYLNRKGGTRVLWAVLGPVIYYSVYSVIFLISTMIPFVI